MKYHEKKQNTLQSKKIGSNLREEKLNHDCILGSKSLIIDVIQILGENMNQKELSEPKNMLYSQMQKCLGEPSTHYPKREILG